MKTFTSKMLMAVMAITVISFTVNAQTNVSGGIYTNTTWTLTNSPYIVTDTVVVFPGVTLTIEPGVVVKFNDHVYIEIRQAILIATGNATDSITFTSNNPAPTPGIWGHQNYGAIYFHGTTNLPSFNYWNISYAITGIETAQYLTNIRNSTFSYNLTAINSAHTSLDSCVFKYNGTGISVLSGNTISVVLNNCTFSNNNVGIADVNKAILINCKLDSNYRAIGGLIGSGGSISSSKFYNCSFSYNHEGWITAGQLGGNLLQHCVLNFNTAVAVFLGSNTQDTVHNCEIKYNGTGVTVYSSSIITHCDIEYDTLGIKLYGNASNIYCNKICNNISYGLQMLGSNNFNVSNNYWCTNDSSQIAAAIYDGYDNINYGLVTFLPTDSACYLSTGIADNSSHNILITIYPNPVSDHITVTINNHDLNEIILYDIASRKILQQTFTNSTTLNTTQLTKGIYMYEVRNKNGVIKQGKVVKE